MEPPNSPIIPNPTPQSLARSNNSKLQLLSSNLSEIHSYSQQIQRKKEKIKKVSQEIQSLTTALHISKVQRDINIGQNYIKSKQKQDKQLSETKSNLEQLLIHTKEEFARLSIQVQEYEDMIQTQLQSCKLYDQQIQKLTSELDSIKYITPPPPPAPPAARVALNNSFTSHQPIQLNARKAGNRRSESFGGFK